MGGGNLALCKGVFMAQVHFKRPATVGKMTYGAGVHNVPDSDTENWFFKALQKDGLVPAMADVIADAIRFLQREHHQVMPFSAAEGPACGRLPARGEER